MKSAKKKKKFSEGIKKSKTDLVLKTVLYLWMKNKNKQNLSLYRIDCMAWKGFFYTDLRLRCLKI